MSPKQNGKIRDPRETASSMSGKVVIVTGANSGLGFHTASSIASAGGRVILACRDELRGKAARDKIVQSTGNTQVILKQLDLASLASIRTFAKDIISTENRLDVLINNAGVHTKGMGKRYTQDGIFEGLQVNYLGPFLLTLLLLDLLKKSKSSRIVNVNSIMHFLGRINFDTINKVGIGDTRSYSDGKLCNMIFTVELAKRLQGTGVVVNAVHPGVMYTNITKYGSGFITDWLFWIWCWLYNRTPEQGADTITYLAVSDQCEKVSGSYFVDCAPKYFRPIARDPKVGAKLWQLSCELVGYEYK